MTARRRIAAPGLMATLVAAATWGGFESGAVAAPAIHTESMTVKSLGPIEISVSVDPAFLPGQIGSVTLTLHSAADLENVRMSFDADDDLTLFSNVVTLPALGAGSAPQAFMIDVLPAVAGRHLLTVFVTAQSGTAGSVARSVTIPIRAGENVAGNTAAAARAPSRAEALQTLPAVETIR